MPVHRTITFSLNGMLFEYDEEKISQILKSMVFHFQALLVYSLTTTESKCTMRKIA